MAKKSQSKNQVLSQCPNAESKKTKTKIAFSLIAAVLFLAISFHFFNLTESFLDTWQEGTNIMSTSIQKSLEFAKSEQDPALARVDLLIVQLNISNLHTFSIMMLIIITIGAVSTAAYAGISIFCLTQAIKNYLQYKRQVNGQ